MRGFAARLHDPQFVLQTEQGAEHVGIEHRGTPVIKATGVFTIQF
jgi:hypothetical protein